MKAHLIISLLLITIYISHTQAATCPNQCSKRGRCNTAVGKCICPFGWFDEDCSKSVQHVLPNTFLAYRIVNGILFMTTLIIAILVLIAKRRRETLSAQNISFSRSQNAILGFVILLSVTNFMMHTVDPWNMLGNYPYEFFRILFAINFPALISLFSVIIFHWANMYHSSIKLLKDNEKLKKINQNYKGEITIQEVIERGAKNVKALSYIKVVLIILNFLTWSLQLIREVLLGKKIVTMKTKPMQVTWLGWLMILYVSLTIGIIYYAPKLLSIMPPQIARKMRRITRTMIVMSIMFCVAEIIVTITMTQSNPSAGSFVAGDWCFRFSILLILFTMLSFFLKFNNRFPWIVVIHSKSKGSSTSGDIGMHTSQSNPPEGTSENELSFM